MRLRVAGVALVSAAVWLSQWVWYEQDIFPLARHSHVYRAGEAAICLALVLLALFARTLKALEWGALGLFCALTTLHGYALLTVADSCVVPFLLTLEWSNIVIALAAALSYRPALILFVVTWLVGAVATRLRPGFDADLSDHVVLAVIYATVVVSVRNYDRTRVAAQVAQRDLELANDALQRADAARTRLFTHLSHDLRTPLALIDGEAQSLEAAPGAPEAAAALERIHLHTASLVDLVEQLLQVAKLDATEQEPQLVDFDLNQLVRQTVAQFDGGKRAGKVLVGALPAAAVARADLQHVRRILHNLLANAARQLEHGATGVVVTLALLDEKQLTLSVENDGPEIPLARRAAIFERFASFDAAGGVASGLGLPLARELAQLNGGELVLDPLPGRTVFRVTLPRSNAEAPADIVPLAVAPAAARAAVTRAHVDASGESAAPHRRLLLVEDNADLARLLEGMLSARFTVQSAPSLAQAFELLAQRKPDLLLVDLMLPDGSGLEIIERLPELVAGLAPPVVCLSAVAEESARVDALARGARDFLLKPFSADELLARLDAVLRSDAQHAELLLLQRRALLAELHDGVNAALARAAMLLEAAQGKRRLELVPKARSAVLSALDQARSLSVLEVRDVVPLTASLLELEQELRSVLGGFDVTTSFTSSSDGSLGSLTGVEHHLLGRLLAEAATNALKHGHPTRLDCSLVIKGSSVELTVLSDGVGKASAQAAELSTGSGMRLALLRLGRLGGSLESAASSAETWTLRAVFPGALSLRRDSQIELLPRSSAA